MADRVYLARCATCTGMTACCVVEDGNTAEQRAAGRMAKDALAAGRTVEQVTVEQARAATVCKCPKPKRKARP